LFNTEDNLEVSRRFIDLAMDEYSRAKIAYEKVEARALVAQIEAQIKILTDALNEL